MLILLMRDTSCSGKNINEEIELINSGLIRVIITLNFKFHYLNEFEFRTCKKLYK